MLPFRHSNRHERTNPTVRNRAVPKNDDAAVLVWADVLAQ